LPKQLDNFLDYCLLSFSNLAVRHKTPSLDSFFLRILLKGGDTDEKKTKI